MAGGGAAGSTSGAIDKLADALKNLGGSKEVTITLNKSETKNFLENWHVKVHREA